MTKSYEPVIIICQKIDSLYPYLLSFFQKNQLRLIQIIDEQLANIVLTIKQKRLYYRNESVGGVIFRSSPLKSDFSKDYIESDKVFINFEVRAIWLAIININTFFVLNRYNASAWFNDRSWTYLRNILHSNRIPLTPFTYGAKNLNEYEEWYPYTQYSPYNPPNFLTRKYLGTAISRKRRTKSSIVLFGDVVSGENSRIITEVTQILRQEGLNFFEIVLDDEDRVIIINPCPNLVESDLPKIVAQKIVSEYIDFMHNR